MRSLDRSLIRGIAWTGIGRWGAQIISWIATPFVARLLSPGDYGVASMALVYAGLVQLINEFGLGAAIVQRRDLTADQIARLGGLSVSLGAFFLTLSVGLSSWIAGFFESPDVGPVIAALSVTFLTSGVQALPRALLMRDLKFRQLAMLDGLEALVHTATTLILAVLGFRYWALVLGVITSRTAGMIMALVWGRHPLAWPFPFKTISSAVTIGFHLVAGQIAWYTFTNADLAIIGRRLGSAALGSYTVGMTLASIPVERLSVLIAGATPGIFSTVQRDLLALRRYILVLTEGIALLTFPAAAGLALVAEEFVIVVLGEPWRAAITPLRLLAVAGMFRSVMVLLTRALVATGHSKRSMQVNLVMVLVLPPLFYVASQWGIVGVAFVWLAAYPLISSILLLGYAFTVFDINVKLYLRVLWPAASSTFLMAVVVLAIDLVASGRLSLYLLLAAKAAAGAVAYLALVWYLHGGRLRSFFSLVRERRPQDDKEVDLQRVTPESART